MVDIKKWIGKCCKRDKVIQRLTVLALAGEKAWGRLPFLVAALLMLLTNRGHAQGTYTNEWINFDQTYFKLSVAEDGIYKVPYSALSAAGFPMDADPRNIQLFHRGVEQAITVQGESDGNLDGTDYLLFYGERNDGTLDKQLYVHPDAQPHNYYNLYSDTTAYFLTIAQSAGKRMKLLQETGSGLPAIHYHTAEKLVVYAQNYWTGREYSVDTYLSQYDYAEGWTGTAFRGGQSRDIVFEDIVNAFSGGGNPRLEMILTGRNANIHNVEVLVGPSESALRPLTTVQFFAQEYKTISPEITWTDISPEGKLVVRVLVQATETTDYISISAVRLDFPQQIDMEGENAKLFSLNNLNTKAELEITNVTGTPTIYDITQPDNVSKWSFTASNGTVTTILPASGSKKIWVANAGATLTVPHIKEVAFQNITPTAYDFLIVSNARLMVPVAGVANPVAAYAAYRTSAAGGSFSPLIVEAQQLFDQFNYGEPSPLAIREFARFMFNNGNPQYLFLIGKGLSVIYDYYRKGAIDGQYHDLVPTLGHPGSDAALTEGLDSSFPHAPAIPTGRLTAETPQHVMDYLNKVKEMEATPYDALWRKRLIHLSGGATENELLTFKRYVNEFKAVAEGHYLGANVITKSKQTNNAVELINIAEEVNKGVGLITFFGHSGAATTDLEIGNASEDAQGYRNQGKYPFILVNGCDAGNIFANVYTFGEDWIITPDRGAVGFIAHVAKGLSSNLKRYSDLFYATAFADSAYIHKSIGKVLKKVTIDYMNKYSASPAHISQVQQMNLQGDPSLKIFGAPKPDFEINAENIAVQSFDENVVTALSDSFNVALIVRNFGITTHDSLHVQLKRKLSNGTFLFSDSVYFPVFFSDTLNFTVHNFSENENFGNNQFEVSLDYINRTAEIDENNNVAVLDYFIPLGGTTNVYPPDFAIVSAGNPELVSQSNDVLGGTRTFIFQIDTAHTFNSPVFSQHTVQAQALASWKPGLLESLAKDSIVYFWRTKFADPKPGEDASWTTSSFVYIQDSPEGWSQSHFFQYNENKSVGLSQHEETRKLEFLAVENPIRVVTYGDGNLQKDYLDMEVFINNTPFIVKSGFKVCRNNAMGAIAFDKSSAEPYLIFDKSIWNDPIACGRSPFVINNFSANEIINNLKLNAYIDAVQEGDYVLLFSFGRNTYESWPQEVKDALVSLGASQTTLDNLKDGEPFILLGKKGGTAIAELTGEADGTLHLEETIIGRYDQAVLTSPKIGPAQTWGTMIAKAQPAIDADNDTFYYDVIGLDLQGNETLLLSNISSEELSLTSIDAAQYPLLKLQMHIFDATDLTPAQLDKWLVLYEPVPEGVLLLDAAYQSTLPTVEKLEGEEIEVGYVFRNISNKDFGDSLTVSYSIFNKPTRNHTEKSIKIAPLPAKDTVKFTIPVTTLQRRGKNNIKVYVNPKIIPEQHYNNNVIDLQDYLEVKGDLKHPVIDVAFDGRYIMDGDIVSPDPLISVVMKDDSPFLRKQDTLGVEIMIKKPCETCVFEKVNFSSPNIVWYPATEDSDFKVEYRPGVLEDGMYSLKVQATDGSGNVSGTKPYQIHFEVINESAITNFYPYPNPFSTSTRFVFTLTGKEIPDQIKIQIMTVTGKIVREITQNELGPLKIGNNISDFAWDGKDEYGDQLANGVYLYRVTVMNHGEKLKQRETSADKAFKNGFGKMYLLR